ncbi:carbonic anhydrase [Kamptonema formosum]|uniref:carbonic anhydrase n=1 Tax=Kamptonema formosum TaxID=331992 RepID=UPI0004767F3A|nr:carbonic anhydrase [Oscillatoria sp. PCC 10802]
MKHSSNCPPKCPMCAGVSRRHFLRSLLPGALALSVLSAAEPARAEHTAKALVLSCIDFRFLEAERYLLALKNLSNQYDWTALAGASLALSGFPNGADTDAFWDQLEISYKLNHIKKVIILDHQDCGAYALKVDPNLTQNFDRELKVHSDYLNLAYWSIRDRYRDLNVELYFVTQNTELKAVVPVARG